LPLFRFSSIPHFVTGFSPSPITPRIQDTLYLPALKHAIEKIKGDPADCAT